MKSSLSKRVSVIGAGGHARSVIALLQSNGFVVSNIYDDSYAESRPIEYILGVPLKGKLNAISNDDCLVLAIGDNEKRAVIYQAYKNQIWEKSIFHPTAILEKETTILHANLVFPRVFINACAIIGENNIINSAAIVEHECRIGNHNHISVNATLCGRVTIGDFCFIGARAVIRDKAKVTDNVIVGAGGVVVKDIIAPGIYVGNPVRKIK